MMNKYINQPLVAAKNKATFTIDTGLETSGKKSPKVSSNHDVDSTNDKTSVGVISNSVTKCPVSEKVTLSDELKEHIKSSSMMELRKEFKQESNSHRNMLQRVKTHGAVVHPEFKNFKSFLLHVGPMPTKNATLDRINNSDPEYAPGKVRWADKITQNNNKSDTLTFYCSKTKTIYTASQLAKMQKKSADAIRKRKKRGWSDDEIIAGSRKANKQSKAKVGTSDASGNMTVSKKLSKAEALQQFVEAAKKIQFEEMKACISHFEPDFEDDEVLGSFEGTRKYILKNYGKQECKIIQAFFIDRVRQELWPDFKSSICFADLSEVQKLTIQKVDPDWYEKHAWR